MKAVSSDRLQDAQAVGNRLHDFAILGQEISVIVAEG
jgi:hypothetical protein